MAKKRTQIAPKASEEADAQKRLQTLITRTHPDYKERLEHWQFLDSTYKSDRDWFEENLFQFTREGEATFEKRKERAYRFNHTREIVDLLNKYLFKNKPHRSNDVPPFLKQFRTSTTMSGLSILDFEREVARKASIFGRVYVVVDSSVPEDAVVSLADQKAGRGGRLYAYIVEPKDFMDCGYDDYGNYEWCLIREQYRDDNDPFTSTGEWRERFRLWTKTGWQLFKTVNPVTDAKTIQASTPANFRGPNQVWNGTGNVEMVEEGTHGLNMVPVLKADHIESDSKYWVPALIEDIAYLDRAVANYLSCLDQIVNDQTFSQLVMPAQALMPGVAPVEGQESENDPDVRLATRKMIEMGTSQVLLYDGEHGKAPEYISPDPRQANLIIGAIRQIINEIYHTVGMAGERTKQDNSMGIDNSSGVAKAYDFEKVNALLSAKANSMQMFANRLEVLVRRWNKEKTADISDVMENPAVIYSNEFDVRSLSDELAITQQLSLFGAPQEVRQEQMKLLIKKLWPMASAKLMAKLEKAVDEWEDPLYSSVTGDLPSVAGGRPQPGQGSVKDDGSDKGEPKAGAE